MSPGGCQGSFHLGLRLGKPIPQGHLEPQPPALHRYELAAADHEVVEHHDIDQLACLDHGTCDRHIRTRSGITARVVVRDDDRCSVCPYGRAQKLAYPHHRLIE